jgi:putative aminopeptidase FrvX
MRGLESKAFLAELTSMSGVSGYEDGISRKIAEVFREYCDEVTRDPFYNVYGRMYAEGEKKSPRIMISAHMDEIGMMVTEIDDRGFIKFTNIGGIDQRVLLAQEVTVHGSQDLFGVIGAKPPHLQKPGETSKAVKMDDMAIDVGLPGEKVREIVQVGDLISFNGSLLSLQGDMVTGKSLDDRAGVAMLMECMKELKKLHFQGEVVLVASAQEEVGVRGATVSAYRLEPDIGIAIDVTHGETPDAPKERTSPMDKGPCIAIGPNIHPKLAERLMETAGEYGIQYVVDVGYGPTGTDARAIQISRQGVPTLLLELPLRYMHTTVETLNMKNVKSAARLLALFIAGLGDDVEGLLCY